MKLVYKFFAIIVFFSVSFSSVSAELPQLPVAPEIQRGRLPNGIEYYLVTNKTYKGIANMSVVRKAKDQDLARENLLKLPNFIEQKPYEFLASVGVTYDKNGFVTIGQNSSVFNFRNIPVYDAKLTDKMMMLLFDIIASSQADQAIVVSGDINPAKLIDRMQLFSMLVPERKHQNDEENYVWSAKEREVKCETSKNKEVAKIQLVYRAPRTPKEYLNTVQPLVTTMFSCFFGDIVKERLVRELREQNIPVADVQYSYKSSSDGSGDEKYSLEITTKKELIVTVSGIMAQIFATLDDSGAKVSEYKEIKKRYISRVKSAYSNSRISNETYVHACVTSYLYGANLASLKDRAEFFLARDMATETELNLFNNYIFALMSGCKNSSLTISADFVKDSDLANGFDLTSGSDSSIGIELPLETLIDAIWNTHVKKNVYEKSNTSYNISLPGRQRRLKIKSERKEPISNGDVWTFANGMTVLFKQTKTKEVFDFSLMFRGGYANIPNLKRGEGAFISDMLSLYDVAGLRYYDFQKLLANEGFSLKNKVDVTDMTLSGTAPNDKLELLLKYLLAIANERKLNTEAFDYYMQNENLRLHSHDNDFYARSAVMDSLLCVDYICSPYKDADNLNSDIQKKADKYYNKQFSKFNDSVFIIMGNFDPDYVKAVLVRYLRGFKTSYGMMPRPKVSFRIGAGSSTYIVEGEHPSVNIVMSTPYLYTADNFMAAKIAGYILKDALCSTIGDTGMYFKAVDKFEMLPEDRYTFRIFTDYSKLSGLPAGVVHEDPLSVLFKLRKTIKKVGQEQISGNRLSEYKKYLLNTIESDINNPHMIMKAVSKKYTDGKDLLNKYSNRINAVSTEKVQEILRSLSNSSRIEYVIKKPKVDSNLLADSRRFANQDTVAVFMKGMEIDSTVLFKPIDAELSEYFIEKFTKMAIYFPDIEMDLSVYEEDCNCEINEAEIDYLNRKLGLEKEDVEDHPKDSLATSDGLLHPKDSLVTSDDVLHPKDSLVI